MDKPRYSFFCWLYQMFGVFRRRFELHSLKRKTDHTPYQPLIIGVKARHQTDTVYEPHREQHDSHDIQRTSLAHIVTDNPNSYADQQGDVKDEANQASHEKDSQKVIMCSPGVSGTENFLCNRCIHIQINILFPQESPSRKGTFCDVFAIN